MRAYQSRRQLVVENLENRRLLAADLNAGVLTITGTNKSDKIAVTLADTQISVAFNKQTYEFNAADVTAIQIDGSNGNDWIWVDDAIVVNAVINGGLGNDRIKGGGGNDTISGDKGNDRLRGGLGNDTINAGVGNDWAWGDDGDDIVHGDYGNDHVFGGAGNDQVYGDVGQDAVSGDDGDDVLYGGFGHDRLHGGAGNDQLYGEAGKDLLFGELGDDQIFGGDDKDHLWGGWGNDILKGGAGDDHLDGGAGDNLLDGDEGANQLKNGFSVDLDQNLVAELSNATGTSAVATFQYQIVNGQVVQKLIITVDNVPTDGMNPVVLDVTIDSQSVGSITADPLTGDGSLTFSTNPSSPDELAFPAGFTLQAGSTITIGSDLSGSFVAVFA